MALAQMYKELKLAMCRTDAVKLESILGVNEMTKEFALDLIKLLSAMESWSFSTKESLPDFLLENLNDAVAKLSEEVLK